MEKRKAGPWIQTQHCLPLMDVGSYFRVSDVHLETEDNDGDFLDSALCAPDKQ